MSEQNILSNQSRTSLFKQISDLSTSLCNTPLPESIEKSASTGCVQPAYLSEIEASVLRSISPISVNETEEINVLGNRGVWTNRIEELEWKGDLPLSHYVINEDTSPEIINKKYEKDVEYIQELAVRYLRPPPLPTPGDIIINQEPNYLAPPAPPLVIRQQPPRPCTPQPLVVREIPPSPPIPVGKKIITISGKSLPPPPRKVVIERLPQVPAKPQGVITERWLPYPKTKRRVIYQAAPPDPVYCKPRNVIVQWDSPNVVVRQEVKFLGVVNANPVEYVKRYGENLKKAYELPEISRNIPVQEGYILAADVDYNNFVYELEGDLEALKLIDLEAEGLSAYKPLITNNTTLRIISSENESTSSLTASSVRLSTDSNDLLRIGSSSASLGVVESNRGSTNVLSVSQLLSSARPSKSALKSESSGQIKKHALIVESFNQEFDITKESVNTTLNSEPDSPSTTSALGPEELNKLVQAIKTDQE